MNDKMSGDVAYVVGVYVVHSDRVILVWHDGLSRWVPAGGRIELEKGEYPHEAARREVLEELGLDVEILASPPVQTVDPEITILPQPVLLQEIALPDGTRYLDIVYLASSSTAEVDLDYREARGYHWFSFDDLERFPVPQHVRDYGRYAIQEARRPRGWRAVT